MMMRILTIFFTLLGFCAVNISAQDKVVVFSPDSIKGTNKVFGTNAADSMMCGGIAIFSKHAAFAIDNTGTYRFYANGSTIFSALFGTIKKVEFTFDSDHKGGFKTVDGNGKYTPSKEGYKGTWEGEAKTFTLTNNSLSWVKQIQVTYTSSVVVKGDGTRFNPFLVEDILDLYNADVNAEVLKETYVYIKGKVGSVMSMADEIINQKSCSYSVVDNLGDEDSIVVNGGHYLNDSVFSSTEQLKEGDQVIISGRLSSSQDPKTGNKIVEVMKGNYIAQFWGNELTIDEGREKNEIIGDMRHATVRLCRKFNKEAWNSLVLPFDMTEKQVLQTFGNSTQLADYVGTTENDDRSFTLNFNQTKNITANTPVFVYGANATVDKTIEDVCVKKSETVLTPSGAAFAFTGGYDKMSLRANDWFISKDNKFYLAKGGETMKGTRAVFRPVKTGSAPQSVKSNLVERPTGVVNVKVEDCKTSNRFIYNLSGQRVSESYRGIVIKRGKKYVRP